MTDVFFLNFNAVGFLVTASFAVLTSLFLVFLRNASGATRHLGMALLSMGLVNTAYVVSSTLYFQTAAYHRWFTIAGALFAATFVIQFILQFPNEVGKKLRFWALTTHGLYSLVIVIVFGIESLSAEYIYHFDGHYWDFKLDAMSANIATIATRYITITNITTVSTSRTGAGTDITVNI